MQMRAARTAGPGEIELTTVARPAPGPREILVRVRACGICGSDLHYYTGAFPPSGNCPGHEISGEIATIGADVRNVAPGDRVVIEPVLRCGLCWACSVGDYQLCDHFRLLGTTDDGGFADFVCVPAYTAFHLPSELDFEVGALAEPLAVAVHGMRLGGVRMGHRIAVLGAGAVGLLVVLAARAAGVAEILVTARHPHQAAAARSLGATAVFPADGDGLAALVADAGSRPVDAVIETVGGQADTLLDAMRVIRKGGTVVVLGIFTRPPALDPLLLALKEPHIIGSLTYGRCGSRADFDVALDVLVREAARAGALITHRFPLEAIAAAFATAATKRAGALKVTVVP